MGFDKIFGKNKKTTEFDMNNTLSKNFGLGNKGFGMNNTLSKNFGLGGMTNQKGASQKMQSMWANMTTPQRAQMRRTHRDSDGDGVPDKWDCQPYNKYKQDSDSKSLRKYIYKCVDEIINPKLKEEAKKYGITRYFDLQYNFYRNNFYELFKGNIESVTFNSLTKGKMQVIGFAPGMGGSYGAEPAKFDKNIAKKIIEGSGMFKVLSDIKWDSEMVGEGRSMIQREIYCKVILIDNKMVEDFLKLYN